MGSYFDSEQGLIHTPLVQNQWIHCQSEEDARHWYQLETMAKLQLCKQKVVGTDIGNIIIAQHSIAHMVITLNSHKYAGFSHQAVSALINECKEGLVA